MIMQITAQSHNRQNSLLNFGDFLFGKKCAKELFINEKISLPLQSNKTIKQYEQKIIYMI